MDLSKTIKRILILSCLYALPVERAFADDMRYEQATLPVYSISSAENEFAWYYDEYDYSMPNVETQAETSAKLPPDIDETLGLPVKEDENKNDESKNEQPSKKQRKHKKDKFVDKILAKLPYSQTIQGTWKVIDGDTDLYIKGLRVDRNAKGVSYSTSEIPGIGEIEGVEFRAVAGMNSEMTFESSTLPFVGHVEGMKIKTKITDENSAISVRYNISLDQLGL